jgi:mono/diheme cytochrome c family protein
MILRSTILVAVCSAALMSVGCKVAPGKPVSIAGTPEQVLDFRVLYQENCAGCHGENGKNGAAIALANPIYLEFATVDAIRSATANGVSGSLMPAFAKSRGGMLTDQQVVVLAEGMKSAWGNVNASGGQTLPAYASRSKGEAIEGQKVFVTFCGRCHGVDGKGTAVGNSHVGSLVDPAYLALISDQGLRSLTVSGEPAEGMPDWRSDIDGAGARAMTDQEITDVVAWLASHRVDAPGQPYTHP